ncbi:ABC transporter substrate-binding protein [Romboutsia ilealis]|uniref:ABC transporter substrate-binding protein n=1 Tax=Romboutsia faecis TaxID=2764597 RepID=A0ABR7JQY4_9FIRM|nr:ABC transporter substrate-binding protein [Romboutsia faecis]MBC5997192.1 ABC transporter substrate-binding protein [Romboutsia faecis]MRN23474.1 ABC transporter substrate-binding protein [Romboutsia ilealis]
MKNKKLISLFVTSLLTLNLVGCSSTGNEGQSEQGGTTKAAENTLYTNGGPEEFFEAPWLNPGTFVYNKVLYDRLIFADENLDPIPGEGQLAKSYEMSEDGLNLKFTLRENVFWHDGEPITPQDIKWSIEYSLKTTVINNVFANTFKAIEGATEYLDGKADDISGITIDGNNIDIKFEKLAPDALLTFTQFAPLPEKHLKDVDPVQFQQSEFFRNPIGSGPFKVEEVKMGNYTTLAGFDKYWDGAPTYKMHLNPSAGDSDPNLVTNAKGGLLDYSYTKNIADVKSLDGVEGINVDKVDVRYTRLFFANKFKKKDGSEAPLADKKVRQAIMYALDMDEILDGIFDGAAEKANSLTPDGVDKVDGLNNYDYDPEKAKKLLEEANWDPNTELDVVYYYDDQQTVDLMSIIQNYLSQVGIKMKFRLVEGDLATLLWSLPEDPVNGPSAVDFDLCYGATAALSMHEYYDRYQTGAALNSHTPGTEELDKLIEATNKTIDAQEQREAFFNLQKYENEELFVLPLYYQPIYVITSDKIQGMPEKLGNPQFNYKWDIHKWTLAE